MNKKIRRSGSASRFAAGCGLLLILLVQGCAGSGPGPDAITPAAVDDYPEGRLLVEPRWLEAVLDHDQVRVIDMRPADRYAEGHVPGAVNVPIGDISSTVNEVALEFDRAEVQDTLNSIALEPSMTAVIYDNLGMMSSARMFWTLEYVGHADVRVLNGGWNAWEQAGLPISDSEPSLAANDYPIELQEMLVIDLEGVQSSLEDPQVGILDVRSPQEYRGEVRFSRRGGHIPGAVNLAWIETLAGGDAIYTVEDGWEAELRDADVERFAPAEQIMALLDERGIEPDKEIITYCQTFWRGAHAYFMLRLMGYENVRGYDGSWSEWGNLETVPVVSGPEPG